MKQSRFLEAITTKYLVLTVVIIIFIIIGGFSAVLYFHVTDVDKLSKFVDALFKAIAILVGAIWTLNRFYIKRTDANQFKVDSEVSVIRDKQFIGKNSELALFIYRLDVINTGSSLIPLYNQFLEIESVTPSEGGVQYQPLYRWPSIGLHPGGNIEPNSWSAINDSISIPSNVKAIRLYLEIHLSETDIWTWHKTFDLSMENTKEK